MKLSDMVPLERDIQQARASDPEFRRKWDASAFARAVAIEIVRYRADNNLTQAQLGEMTGLSQPAVARLESGDQTPTLKTLQQLSAGTGIKFRVDVVDGVPSLAAA